MNSFKKYFKSYTPDTYYKVATGGKSTWSSRIWAAFKFFRGDRAKPTLIGVMVFMATFIVGTHAPEKTLKDYEEQLILPKLTIFGNNFNSRS